MLPPWLCAIAEYTDIAASAAYRGLLGLDSESVDAALSASASSLYDAMSLPFTTTTKEGSSKPQQNNEDSGSNPQKSAEATLQERLLRAQAQVASLYNPVQENATTQKKQEDATTQKKFLKPVPGPEALALGNSPNIDTEDSETTPPQTHSQSLGVPGGLQRSSQASMEAPIV